MRKLFQTIYASGQGRWVLWTPVLMMVGISFYFQLPQEPPYWAGPQFLSLSLILALILRRHPARFVAVALLLIAIGFCAAQIRAETVYTKLLTSEIRFANVEGTIDEIEPVEKRIKLVLTRPSIEGVAPEDTPRRIRVSFRDNGGDWQVGDRVRMQATLYPLPGAGMPGGYDFARHFYFRSIGGSGYALRPPVVIADATESSFAQWIGNLRHVIGEDMRAHMEPATGAVAAAMTVGETGPIPENIKESLRNSGLAHMLSISGLHLGLVAGIVFFALRLLLALIPALALRIPIKKVAAIFALIAAAVYLMLAGSPVPAQRAFIMVALLFTGYVLDRSSVSLRTIAIAATVILLLLPEAMMGASFQLSFAATLAIIALFEGGKSILYRGQGVGGFLYRHFASIAFTSFVATLATAPFILYNFNRIATFSILSNAVVIPLATFTIMPGMVIALMLMPFGLQNIGYWPLEKGTAIMIRMGEWVNSLPYSSPRLPSLTDWGLGVAAFGLLVICLLRGRVRWAGVPFMLLGLSTISLHADPDLLISRDGRQVMLKLDDGRYTMLKGSPKGFTAQNWLRAQGQEETVKPKEAHLDCTKERCDVIKNGYRIILVKAKWDSAASVDACAATSDILTGWQYFHHDECSNAKNIVGRAEMERYGAYQFYLGKDGITSQRAQEQKPERIWQVPVKDIEEDSDD